MEHLKFADKLIVKFASKATGMGEPAKLQLNEENIQHFIKTINSSNLK